MSQTWHFAGLLLQDALYICSSRAVVVVVNKRFRAVFGYFSTHNTENTICIWEEVMLLPHKLCASIHILVDVAFSATQGNMATALPWILYIHLLLLAGPAGWVTGRQAERYTLRSESRQNYIVINYVYAKGLINMLMYKRSFPMQDDRAHSAVQWEIYFTIPRVALELDSKASRVVCLLLWTLYKCSSQLSAAGSRLCMQGWF